MSNKTPIVGLVMGSLSDEPVMSGAEKILKEFNIPYEKEILSAHRTPKKMMSYAEKAHSRGLKVLIVGAGGAAHLPGMIASSSLLPVIGVPVNITALEGIDALLSIMQMPKGIPVATVAIDNSENAGLLAVRILAINKKSLYQKLQEYQKQMKKKVQVMNKNAAR